MATVMANECYNDPTTLLPVELHTFGSPRTGDLEWIRNTSGLTMPSADIAQRILDEPGWWSSVFKKAREVAPWVQCGERRRVG